MWLRDAGDEPAAEERRPDIADDGFDFGEFGHFPFLSSRSPYGFTVTVPVIVGWISQ